MELAGIKEILDGRRITLIEDAAQAHGARMGGHRVGSLGDAAAFSFYPGKNLGALGDGGAIVTESEELADFVRQYANYGSSSKYQHDILGVNSRLDELQAAVLRVKLRHLDAWNRARREIADRYTLALSGVPLEIPSVPNASEPVWHLYTVRLDERDSLIEYLRQQGVGTGIHYPVPCHQQGAYREQFSEHHYPDTEAICRTTASLPMGPMLHADQQMRVIDLIENWFDKR
jgi:dTDP-4-amino-4,6-dideoxygalactose transaminase